MIIRIEMSKYGNLLNNRPSAKEAVLRMYQVINFSQNDKKQIILDFKNVEILTPSYADEMITQLREKYGKESIHFENLDTEVVRSTLKGLQVINK